MNTMALSDLSKKMSDIDFAILSTRAANGAIAGQPMSNSDDVEYDGDSYFLLFEESHSVEGTKRNAIASLSCAGAKAMLGKPPFFIAAEGQAELIRDKSTFAQHWKKSSDHWFKGGFDTPRIVLIEVHASRIPCWDGEEVTV